jgi:flavin-dependent dehydrogenase
LKDRIRKKDTKREYGIAMVADVEADDQDINARLAGLIEIQPGIVHMGYGWIFPHNGYYSVGVWGPAAYIPDPRGVMKTFLHDNGFNGAYHIKGHIAPMGGIPRTLVGSRVMLAGDAAGFVDPFSGEGIGFALRSGQIAAEVVSDIVFRATKHECYIQTYEERCYQEFGRTFKHALLLSMMMNRFPRLFFTVLTKKENGALDQFLEIPNMKKQYLSYLYWVIPRIPSLLLG